MCKFKGLSTFTLSWLWGPSSPQSDTSHTIQCSRSPLSICRALGGDGGGGGGSPMSHVNFKKWQCRMSLLLFSPMSHVEFKKGLCHMSLYFVPPCRMSLSPGMSRDELKNCPCRPVDLRGRGPYHTSVGACCRVSVIGTACTASFSSFAKGTSCKIQRVSCISIVLS